MWNPYKCEEERRKQRTKLSRQKTKRKDIEKKKVERDIASYLEPIYLPLVYLSVFDGASIYLRSIYLPLSISFYVSLALPPPTLSSGCFSRSACEENKERLKDDQLLSSLIEKERETDRRIDTHRDLYRDKIHREREHSCLLLSFFDLPFFLLDFVVLFLLLVVLFFVFSLTFALQSLIVQSTDVDRSKSTERDSDANPTEKHQERRRSETRR